MTHRTDALMAHARRLKSITGQLLISKTTEIDFMINNVRRTPSEQSASKVLQRINSNKKRSEVEYTALSENLVDLVDYKGEVAFLIKKDSELQIVSRIENNCRIFEPPPKDQIPWLLPRGEEVMKAYKEYANDSYVSIMHRLYDDLKTYHKRHSELPSEEYYDLIVAWDIHTYLVEQFQYSPIVCLYAVPERGKSRTGKSMIYVAYRGIHVESLREPYLIRLASYFRATIFFDVLDIWKKAEKANSEDILLQRFEKGAKVARVINPERGKFRDMQYFDIFGATIIGINEPADRILDTRCVQINMPETSKSFTVVPTPEEALPLKERLLALRAALIGTTLSDIERPAKNRLGDIMKPLLQVVNLVRPGCEESLLRLVEKLEAARKVEKSESVEAQIIKAVLICEGELSGSTILIKRITEEVNRDREERHHFSSLTIGRKLSALGFQKTRTGEDGTTAIITNSKLLEEVAERYGVALPSDCSDPSEASDQSMLF